MYLHSKKVSISFWLVRFLGQDIICTQSTRAVQEGDEHNDSCTEKWAFEENNAFCALCLQTLFVGSFFFFFFSFCDVFCKIPTEILTSGSPETVFFKNGVRITDCKDMSMLPKQRGFFSLSIFFFISIFFGLEMEIYKPAMFLQTNNVSSNTSDLPVYFKI